MSEKPNPSLDCASLVRFSALPLYHGGELQSCWAVIRSSSLLQTPPPNPLHLPFPLDNKKKKSVYILHIPALPGLHINLSQDLPCKKGRKKRVELKSSKPHQRNWVEREKKIWENTSGRPVEISVEVIKHWIDRVKGPCMHALPSRNHFGAYMELICICAHIGVTIFLARRPD